MQGLLTEVGVEVASLSHCAGGDGGSGRSECPLEDKVLPVYAVDITGGSDLVVGVLGGVVGEGKQRRSDDLVWLGLEGVVGVPEASIGEAISSGRRVCRGQDCIHVGNMRFVSIYKTHRRTRKYRRRWRRPQHPGWSGAGYSSCSWIESLQRRAAHVVDMWLLALHEAQMAIQ